MRLTTVRRSPGKGNGLFARRRVRKGTVVAAFRKAVCLDVDACERRRCDLGLPHDSVVHCKGSRRVWCDVTFTKHDVPDWYMMNHGVPNTRPCLVDDGVVWVTTRDVVRGEELVFWYENAPKAWI